jgi:hypothetical protein
VLRRLTISSLLLATALAARAGIDLTPSASEYVAEGIKYQQLIFQQDKQRVQYDPPRGWSFEGGSRQLRLKPPQKNFAEAVIEAIPLPATQPLDEKVRKTLEQEFIANLPPGSQFVKIEQEMDNPIPLNRNHSFEVTASYQLMGEKFCRSVLFVNLPETRLVFRLTARKDDFDALHRDFAASISSWQWLEPDETRPQTAKAAASDSAP